MTIFSGSMKGVDASLVTIRVSLEQGSPEAFRNTVGRVKAALHAQGFMIPFKGLMVLADVEPCSPAWDLPVALEALVNTDALNPTVNMKDTLFLGELSLKGDILGVRGVVSMTEMAKKQGFRRILVASSCAEDAALIEGIKVFGVSNLKEACDFLEGRLPLAQVTPKQHKSKGGLDLSDIAGLTDVKRGLEIAAAGGHNALLVGSPGCGKGMVARRLTTILPPMSSESALEVTKVLSAVGLPTNGQLATTRPFRAPHHTISEAGLLGGSRGASRPGELALAEHGVLLLDEIPEFRPQVAHAMAKSLPADVVVVATANPCPCGYLTRKDKTCSCSEENIARYQERTLKCGSNMFDMKIEFQGMVGIGEPTGEKSSVVAARVAAARDLQSARLGVGRLNSDMTSEEVQRFCGNAEASEATLKVARTIADLESSPDIQPHHVTEASELRLTAAL